MNKNYKNWCLHCTHLILLWNLLLVFCCAFFLETREVYRILKEKIHISKKILKDINNMLD